MQASRFRSFALISGPVLALTIYALTPGLDEAARRTAAIATLMALWWMTEAIPLPATALLPVLLFPLTGVLSLRAATAPYANHVIFLFMGGFMLGLAMQRWNLHRRLALHIVLAVGTRPKRLVGGFMLASAILSMWISNTATVIMLLPVATSTLMMIEEESGRTNAGLATALMLGVAYAASIGGLGTLLGSPPNLVLANFADAELGIRIGMLDWMRYGLPAVLILLPIAWLWLTRGLGDDAHDPRPLLRDELAALGSMQRGEWIVLAVFLSAAFAWIFRQPLATLPGLGGLSDAVIAMGAALLLFVIPVNIRDAEFALDWETASKLPWGILLLFGGGLALAEAISANGLDQLIASSIAALGVQPVWLVVLLTGFLVIFVTELSSNTATANTFIPILAATALGLGVAPLPVILTAALAASCAFMLPVATPPNAVVFGSGRVGLRDMIRTGLFLNLVAAPVLGLLVLWLASR